MYKKYIKRILDIIISALLIIILFPFFIITYLLVKVSLGSPVIFKQKREGLYKKPYVMYKFRVMDFNYDGTTFCSVIFNLFSISNIDCWKNSLKMI